ncbi:hypothetical protein BDZ89DRAFT_320639 [Hymenopellis radicata]|nr:hypothetical protein BDZ89DRAFT_320639 [Hymenopellis radicata]
MLPLADDAHQAALRVHALLVDIARQHQLSPDASKPFIYGAQEELAWRTFLSIYGQRLYDGLERGLPHEADLVLRLDDSGRNDLTIHRAILKSVRAENPITTQSGFIYLEILFFTGFFVNTCIQVAKMMYGLPYSTLFSGFLRAGMRHSPSLLT